jgi:hypothetical protein
MLTNLITNIQKITGQGKESHFGKRWGVATGFQKQFSREDYKFDDVAQTAPTRQLRDQILTAYQNQPKEESRLFVNRLRDESLSFLAQRRGVRMQQMQRLARLNESMTIVVRRVFDVLECFALELNCYVGCTELQTALTRPQHVREVTRFSKSRQPLEIVAFFRARLASPSWSLVIRGRDDRIEFFLIPVGKVMGLSKSEASYEPVAVLAAQIKDDQVDWSLDNKPFSSDIEQELCMALFSKLIDATKQQLESDAMWIEHNS